MNTYAVSKFIKEDEITFLKELIQVAQGKRPATLLLKNCRLVDVYSKEIHKTDISIYRNKIASISPGAVTEAEQVIDCNGAYAMPGLIDPHMHVDTTMLWPNELASVLVPLGTTTVVVDMVNVAHNGGVQAIQEMMDAFEGLPLKAYFSAPSYCPLNEQIETAASVIDSMDIYEMFQKKHVVSIGETVSSKILNLEDDYLARLALCEKYGKIPSGHGGDLPKGDERALDAYVAAGIRDDHCIGCVEDILPRLRRGVEMFLVEAPGREQVRRFFEYIREKELPTDKMCLCIDNITVMDIVGEYGGYLDKPFRIGLQSGLNPVDVVCMGTRNPATHYGLDHQLGSLTPGRIADVVLLEELEKFPPKLVITNGQVVAKDGKMLERYEAHPVTPEYSKSVHLPKNFSADTFRVLPKDHTDQAEVRVLTVGDGKAFNNSFVATLPTVDQDIQTDPSSDILKIAIIERYGIKGDSTTAFAQGFGLKSGAIATTYSVPSNNIVVVGADNEDMEKAVRHLEEIHGGFVVVKDQEILAEVQLPIGGIMSAEPYEELLVSVERANAAAKSLGCMLEHPFFTMAQTVLSSLPDLGLTDVGLIDVYTQKPVSVTV